MSFTLKNGLLRVLLILTAAVALPFAVYLDRPAIGLVALAALVSALNIIAPMLLGGPSERTLRHFKRKSAVRLNMVKATADGTAAHISADFTPLELVALFALWSAKESMDVVLGKMARFTDSEAGNLFDDEFFEQLAQTAAEFRLKGMSREFQSLVQLGEAAAKQVGKPNWEETFRQLRDKMLQRQVDNTSAIQWRL